MSLLRKKALYHAPEHFITSIFKKRKQTMNMIKKRKQLADIGHIFLETYPNLTRDDIDITNDVLYIENFLFMTFEEEDGDDILSISFHGTLDPAVSANIIKTLIIHSIWVQVYESYYIDAEGEVVFNKLSLVFNN
jgi:hypothetical protein